MIPVPSPHQLHAKFPLSSKDKHFIEASRETVRRICLGKEQRLLIIAGPCSVHDLESCLEYAQLFKKLASEVAEDCFLVMRAYIEKPRTQAGWRGLVHDPHLDESHDAIQGLLLARRFLYALTELEVPCAIEFVTPHLAPYFEDLVSWGCIGARTSSSQIHRLLASHLPMPVGFKNSIDGSIESALSAVQIAHQPQAFFHINDQGALSHCLSQGNPAAHIVLRGSTHTSNYDQASIAHVLNKLRQLELPLRLLVDCAHGNSQKSYERQKIAFRSLLDQIRQGNGHIAGIMIESHLHAGSQNFNKQINQLIPGVSITDPCLDFNATAELIREAATLRHFSKT